MASRLAPAENGSSPRPDHQAVELRLGQVQRLQQAVDHARADQVHLAGDAGDQHLAVQRPEPDFVVLEQLGAGSDEGRGALTGQRLGEVLALVHRQLAARQVAALRRRSTSLRACAPRHGGDRAVEHPGRQRRAAQGLAGGDVFLHPGGHLLPASGLPQLERALLHAEAPAHGQVDLAGGFGNLGQVHRHIVEAVAQDGPQELRLRVGRFTQQLQPLGARASSGCGR